MYIYFRQFVNDGNGGGREDSDSWDVIPLPPRDPEVLPYPLIGSLEPAM